MRTLDQFHLSCASGGRILCRLETRLARCWLRPLRTRCLPTLILAGVCASQPPAKNASCCFPSLTHFPSRAKTQPYRTYFSKYGNLSDVTLMRDKYTGQPRGFAFIKYGDPAVVDAVLAAEHTVDGRAVDVKRAVPRNEAPGPQRQHFTASPRPSADTNKVFVGGLAPSVTVAEFRVYFEGFGGVTDAVVMFDRQTQRSRGFGFVTFDSDAVVQNVLMGTHELNGKMVEVKRAEPKEGRGGRHAAAGYAAGYGGGGGGRRANSGAYLGGRGASAYGLYSAFSGANGYPAAYGYGGYGGYGAFAGYANGYSPASFAAAYRGAAAAAAAAGFTGDGAGPTQYVSMPASAAAFGSSGAGSGPEAAPQFAEYAAALRSHGAAAASQQARMETAAAAAYSAHY
ncbi:unnamed protein product [Phaeothamnion confervicola]